MLAINVVARSKALLSDFVERVRDVWEGHGWEGGKVVVMKDSDETVNVVIVAIKGWRDGSAGVEGGREGGREGGNKQSVRVLEEWLKIVSLSSDPLQLAEVLGKATVVGAASSVEELAKHVAVKTKVS